MIYIIQSFYIGLKGSITLLGLMRYEKQKQKQIVVTEKERKGWLTVILLWKIKLFREAIGAFNEDFIRLH